MFWCDLSSRSTCYRSFRRRYVRYVFCLRVNVLIALFPVNYISDCYDCYCPGPERHRDWTSSRQWRSFIVDKLLIRITWQAVNSTSISVMTCWVFALARTLGESVLDERTRRHSVANGNGEEATRSCLGIVPERMCLPHRPPHGAQTCEFCSSSYFTLVSPRQ